MASHARTERLCHTWTLATFVILRAMVRCLVTAVTVDAWASGMEAQRDGPRPLRSSGEEGHAGEAHRHRPQAMGTQVAHWP
jgi:hypothetical protein